uniref:Uncharacterized protein n=1 Tax=Callorhinchus milii TaxID=7868 RepID=A0A4W3JGB6_CALMI
GLVGHRSAGGEVGEAGDLLHVAGKTKHDRSRDTYLQPLRSGTSHERERSVFCAPSRPQTCCCSPPGTNQESPRTLHQPHPRPTLPCVALRPHVLCTSEVTTCNSDVYFNPLLCEHRNGRRSFSPSSLFRHCISS